MRTAITGSWIVGHEAGRHSLIRDGVVVYEDNKIIHVGKQFEGRVDKTVVAAGKLVAPGFIDTHVHSGHRASHRLITDTGRPMYYGQPFLEISVPKEGKVVKGDPRYLKHGDAGAQSAFELNATFTVRRAVAQWHHHHDRIRQPVARAGRAACGSLQARHPRLFGPATIAGAGSGTRWAGSSASATTNSA